MITKTPHQFSKDDFTVTAVEPWFKVKVQVIQEYFQSFLGETVGRADEIVLVDFFAGSGFYAFGHQKTLLPMPSLLALQQDPPFTKLIFCEQNQECAKALKIRVNKYFRGRNTLLFEEGVDELVEKLRLYIPPSKREYKVAVLCLIDPFSLNFSFATIEKLAALGYSFLMPYTFPLTSRHDFRYYLKEEREKVKRFVGPNESSLFASSSNTEFYKKLVRTHQNNMLTLGLSVSVSAHKIESKQMEMPSFYVGMFSKQVSAKTIANDVKENAYQQFELF